MVELYLKPIKRVVFRNNEYISVELVPVVRCKDCKNQGDPVMCPMCVEEFVELPEGGWDTNIFDLGKDECFCSYGERK